MRAFSIGIIVTIFAMNWRLLTICMLVFVAESKDLNFNITCPNKCSCNPRPKTKDVYVKCKNTHSERIYNGIPRLPDLTSSLTFEGFYLTNVTSQTFQNITKLSLRKLKLRNNHIQNISMDAFSDLKRLQTLEISTEPLVSKHEFAIALSSVTKGIKELTLTYNKWEKPPHFDWLINSSVSHIDLSNNYITNFNGSWFGFLRHLKMLSLGFNGLSEHSYNFSGILHVRNLDLQGNWFREFPDFCKYKFKKLQRLHFQYNKLTSFRPYYFKCLKDLKYLNLNGHAVRKLYNETFSNLTSLETLSLKRLAGQLFHIEELAFKSISLKNLSFVDNGFYFQDKSVVPKQIFHHCPNLTNLDISSNIMKLTEANVVKMLSPLKNLENLNMGNMKIHFLPKGLFTNLQKLKSLNVSLNFLNGSWDGKSVFGNKSNLENLDLSDNSITVVKQSSFPAPLLKGLKFLDLSFNKLSCLCDDIQWLYNWMHDNPKKFGDRLKKVECARPLGGKSIIDLSKTDICPLDPRLVIAIIVFCSIITAILLSMVVLYKLRWHIRHWLYTIKMKKKGYDLIADDPDFKYDIFLVFADEDRRFVLDTIVPYLEKRYFQLCIPDRDFEVAKLHCDNIVENLNLSRRVLLVLSNNFAKSKWCDFQIEFAHNRCLEEKRNNIIVAVLEEISYKYLTNTLRVLLTSHDYALWSHDNEAGQNLFWEKVLCKLQFQVDDTETADLSSVMNSIQ